LRELAPQVLGAVMRRFRDFAAAEEPFRRHWLRRLFNGHVKDFRPILAPG
jgi:hypothetical protein